MVGSLHMASNGMYGVLLHNREDCTDPEIKSLISQYGKIRDYRRVPKSGADLIFVHFQEYEEASACLEHLGKDPMFYAMPARPREGRISKPGAQKELAKSLDRATDVVEVKKKSILRCRSVLAAKARQIDSSSSTDEDKQAGNGLKDVRFASPPRHQQIRSRSRGVPKPQPRDVSLPDESLHSSDQPPHLLNMLDVWTEKFIEESGVLTSIEVIIYNIPLHLTDGHIFALCDQVVNVLEVEVNNFQHHEVPFKFAVVHVRSPDDAKLLKSFLHRRTLKGKVLKVVFSSDFY